MPPLPSVPNVIKVEIFGQYDEVGDYKWANVHHWTYGGGEPTSATCETIAQNIYAAWTEQFTEAQPPQMSLQGCTVTDLSSDMGGQGTYLLATPGGSSADKLPGNVCVLVSKTVDRRYRGGHPRTYLAIGGDENLQDQANWNAGMVTSTTVSWTNFVSGVTGFSVDGTSLGLECCVSYYSGIDPTTRKPIRRDVPLVLDIPADGYTIQAEIASQRRRIGRRR
jgi:hypothetical protein